MKTTTLAPVVLFTYNRPKHTKKTLEALAENELASQSNLYIFSDGAKNEKDIEKVEQVRKYIKWFKAQHLFLSVQIFESKVNKGLAKSIIIGVTQVFLNNESVIVLEDDLLTSVDFLKFMNHTLEKYKSNKRVGCITGYNPLKEIPIGYKNDVYFTKRTNSLGWGTWKGVWDKVDWEAKLYHKFKKSYQQRLLFNASGFDRAKRLDRQMNKDAKSWSILFGFDNFIKNKLTVYAVDSKIIHIGWDGSGVHTSDSVSNFNNKHKISLYPLSFPKKIAINKEIEKMQKDLFGGTLKIKIKDIIIFLLNYFS